jgi:hypothetical protein
MASAREETPASDRRRRRNSAADSSAAAAGPLFAGSGNVAEMADRRGS